MDSEGMAVRRIAYLAVVLALLVAGCGGSDDASDTGELDDDSNRQSDPVASNDNGTGGGTDGGTVDQDGFVTVEGATYAFTYDNFGRCGAEGDNGMGISFGNLLDDPNRQVTVTYAEADNTASGEPIMQVIIMGEGGATQLYYSAVGFGTTNVGSVDSIAVSGDTVRITGQLQRNAEQTLVDFEAEATCDQ